MTKAERSITVRDILTDAKRLYTHRAVLAESEGIRQVAIDNDLRFIKERLREINMHTGVDAAVLNEE